MWLGKLPWRLPQSNKEERERRVYKILDPVVEGVGVGVSPKPRSL